MNAKSSERPEKPTFALDQNFPTPVLADVLDRWIPEIALVALRDLDERLTRDLEDRDVLLALHQRGIDGLVTCDASMVWLPEVVAIVGQTNFSVVACDEAGHDPLKATGMLLAQLGFVSKRHRADQAQIWLLRSRESRPEISLSTARKLIVGHAAASRTTDLPLLSLSSRCYLTRSPPHGLLLV